MKQIALGMVAVVLLAGCAGQPEPYTFLDYLSRDSRGRQVILVSIGSASAIGNPTANRRLIVQRSETPLPVIDQYLVNIPHKYYKVYGLGDMYAPQHATAQVEHRYQSVRLIAVYDTGQLPATSAAGPPARS
jgi:hypothetical protein